VVVVIIAVLQGTGALVLDFTSGGIIIGSPPPELLERHDNIVIEKYAVQLPQTCSNPDEPCTCSDWMSHSFQLNKGEIVTLQMEVVPEAQGARGSAILSVRGGAAGQMPKGVYDYAFYDNEAVQHQSNSFKVADTGYYLAHLTNCENSNIAVSFKLTFTESS
jgi:hypothetical protein